MPRIGEMAPDFRLMNQDGRMVRLSDYRGKKVILFAFPQAFTANCNAQACGFRDSFPRVESARATVLGISPDSPAKLKEWKEKMRLQYDLLSDSERRVLSAWGAWGRPLFGLLTLPRANRSYWVLDESGKVIAEKIGIGPAESVAQALKAVGA